MKRRIHDLINRPLRPVKTPKIKHRWTHTARTATNLECWRMTLTRDDVDDRVRAIVVKHGLFYMGFIILDSGARIACGEYTRLEASKYRCIVNLKLRSVI